MWRRKLLTWGNWHCCRSSKYCERRRNSVWCGQLSNMTDWFSFRSVMAASTRSDEDVLLMQKHAAACDNHDASASYDILGRVSACNEVCTQTVRFILHRSNDNGPCPEFLSLTLYHMTTLCMNFLGALLWFSFGSELASWWRRGWIRWVCPVL